MVLCVIVGCSNRSGREKGVSFFRIPSIITHRTAKDKELSTERRAGFLAAISRADVTDKILQNDRICSFLGSQHRSTTAQIPTGCLRCF